MFFFPTLPKLEFSGRQTVEPTFQSYSLVNYNAIKPFGIGVIYLVTCGNFHKKIHFELLRFPKEIELWLELLSILCSLFIVYFINRYLQHKFLYSDYE
jgi:hypothetical protein